MPAHRTVSKPRRRTLASLARSAALVLGVSLMVLACGGEDTTTSPGATESPTTSDGVVDTDADASGVEEDEEEDAALVLDLPTPTPVSQVEAAPDSDGASEGPEADPPVDGDVAADLGGADEEALEEPDPTNEGVAPEESFSADEAAALTCAHLENGLRAWERGDLDAVKTALAEADLTLEATTSERLQSLGDDWSAVADLDEAEELLFDSLGVCEELGYSL